MSEAKLDAPALGQVCCNGSVWAIIDPGGRIVAKAMSDAEAKHIVCERMLCAWAKAHSLGFRAVVALEQYIITGILHESSN